jgi:hypothetical protein
MKRLSKTARPLLALSLLAISLCGCQTDSAGTEEAATALAAAAPIALPPYCEEVLRNQPVVQPHVGDDYRVLFKRAQNGQIVENSIITKGRECVELQRKLYGGVPQQ